MSLTHSRSGMARGPHFGGGGGGGGGLKFTHCVGCVYLEKQFSFGMVDYQASG